MTSDGSCESLHSHGQTADVVADLDRLVPVTKALRRHDPDRLQTLPERETWQVLGGRKLKVGSRLFTSMARLSSHMLTPVAKVAVQLFVDVVNDRLVQRVLIPLSART